MVATGSQTPGDDGYTPRHREVLLAAMELVAERGLAKASLRELARRVEVSQPSLYHYFESKDQLVEQIIDVYSHLKVVAPGPPAPLTSVGALIAALHERVRDVWTAPDHLVFVRFMLAVLVERPELVPKLRDAFFERVRTLARPLMEPFIRRGEVLEGDRDHVIKLLIEPLSMAYLQEKVFFAAKPMGTDLGAYAAFVADVVEQGVRARARATRIDSERPGAAEQGERE